MRQKSEGDERRVGLAKSCLRGGKVFELALSLWLHDWLAIVGLGSRLDEVNVRGMASSAYWSRLTVISTT